MKASETKLQRVSISTDLGLDYPAAASNVISWEFSKPLDFTPGTKGMYSNFGYQILGRVIEKATGKSYADYIQQDLFGLVNVTNTIGFANIVLSCSRPRDLGPWEIWPDDTGGWTRSAVDYPTNISLPTADGGYYFESFDSFGGLSASAVYKILQRQYNLRCSGSNIFFLVPLEEIETGNHWDGRHPKFTDGKNGKVPYSLIRILERPGQSRNHQVFTALQFAKRICSTLPHFAVLVVGSSEQEKCGKLGCGLRVTQA